MCFVEQAFACLVGQAFLPVSSSMDRLESLSYLQTLTPAFLSIASAVALLATDEYSPAFSFVKLLMLGIQL